MNNKQIANAFNRLGDLMELQDENTFKIRSYRNAYLTLRKLPEPLSEMSDADINSIKGVGKAIAGKIRELLDTGEMATLNKYKEQIPEGIQELLGIKGLGVKKIRQLWQEMGIESTGELYYACNENRLIALKGFGLKTQEDIRQKIEYHRQSRNKFLYASLEKEAKNLVSELRKKLGIKVELTGSIRRKMPILRGIEILIEMNELPDDIFNENFITLTEKTPDYYRVKTANQTPVRLYTSTPDEWAFKLFQTTGANDFYKIILKNIDLEQAKKADTEAEIFEQAGYAFTPPELRDNHENIALAKSNNLPTLITENDIKGVLHNHSTYSDGINTLREMAEYARDKGYAYLGITDHSKSAFYANGLKAERVLEQWAEIDELNAELAPFRIFKGIESDILNDGSLDYDEDILRRFDFIIASVHSNLKMDEAKATQRLLTAIENPYTTMLGHPTGRLLLSRKGYPIDHAKIIDACATNNVSIELNSNPLRLDLDWEWIPYALEKGVKIAINPDAHSTRGIHDIHYGVCVARKGGLTAVQCVNYLTAEEFEAYCTKKIPL